MTVKRIVIPASTVLVLGALALSPIFVTPTYAAWGDWFKGNSWFGGLIQTFEQKFGLDKTQVQQTITDYEKNNPRPTGAPNIQDREKKRLDGLVTAGKITAAQETAILAEYATLRTKYDLANVPQGQRVTQMQAMQAEFKTWLQSQSIDPTIILPGMDARPSGMPSGKPGDDERRGMWRGRWNQPSGTPTVTPEQ